METRKHFEKRVLRLETLESRQLLSGLGLNEAVSDTIFSASILSNEPSDVCMNVENQMNDSDSCERVSLSPVGDTLNQSAVTDGKKITLTFEAQTTTKNTYTLRIYDNEKSTVSYKNFSATPDATGLIAYNFTGAYDRSYDFIIVEGRYTKNTFSQADLTKAVLNMEGVQTVATPQIKSFSLTSSSVSFILKNQSSFPEDYDVQIRAKFNGASKWTEYTVDEDGELRVSGATSGSGIFLDCNLTNPQSIVYSINNLDSNERQIFQIKVQLSNTTSFSNYSNTLTLKTTKAPLAEPFTVDSAVTYGSEASSITVYFTGKVNTTYEVGYVNSNGSYRVVSKNVKPVAQLTHVIGEDQNTVTYKFYSADDDSNMYYQYTLGEVTQTGIWVESAELPADAVGTGITKIDGISFKTFTSKTNPNHNYYMNDLNEVIETYLISEPPKNLQILVQGSSVIKGLKASSTYTAFVRAKATSDYAASESVLSEKVTTWSVLKKPALGNGNETTDTSVLLKVTNWNKIFPNPSVNSSFVVKAVYTDSNKNSQEFEVEFVYDLEKGWTSTSGSEASLLIADGKVYVELNNLLPYTKYTFTARAYDSLAVSSESRKVAIRTAKIAATAPTEVATTLTPCSESSSITVTWEGDTALTYSVGYIYTSGKKEIMKYATRKVKLTQEKGGTSAGWGAYIIKGLKANTEYTVFVQANATKNNSASDRIASDSSLVTYGTITKPSIKLIKFTEDYISLKCTNANSLKKSLGGDLSLATAYIYIDGITVEADELTFGDDGIAYFTADISSLDLLVGNKYSIQAQVYTMNQRVSPLSNKINGKVTKDE